MKLNHCKACLGGKHLPIRICVQIHSTSGKCCQNISWRTSISSARSNSESPSLAEGGDVNSGRDDGGGNPPVTRSDSTVARKSYRNQVRLVTLNAGMLLATRRYSHIACIQSQLLKEEVSRSCLKLSVTTDYRDVFEGGPHILWLLGEKITFFCLQRSNFSTQYHTTWGPPFRATMKT